MLKNVFRVWAPVPQGHKSLWGQSALASVHSEGGLLVPLKAVPDIQPALEVGAAPVADDGFWPLCGSVAWTEKKPSRFQQSHSH